MFFVYATQYHWKLHVLRQYVWWWSWSSSTVECILFMEICSDLCKAPYYVRSHEEVCVEPLDCSAAIISKSSNALFPESIINPPFCGLNIVQRLHHKVDLYRTSQGSKCRPDALSTWTPNQHLSIRSAFRHLFSTRAPVQHLFNISTCV